MAAFVVDTEPDLEFVGTQMSVGYRGARNLIIQMACVLGRELRT